MNEVVGESWMVRLLQEERLQNLSALSLVGESFVGLGSGNIQGERMKYRSFVVLRMGRLQRRHLLFKSLRVDRIILAVFAINLGQGLDIFFLSAAGL